MSSLRLDLLTRRGAWILLALVVGVLLLVGSVHPPASTRAARIAHLDAVIKCPACNDLSIGQSDIVQARELRAKVATLVDAGRTDVQIEAYVVGLYGPDELLSPPRSGLSLVAWILPGAAIAGALVGLGLALWRRRRPGAPGVGEDDEALVAAAAGRIGGGV